MNIELSLSELNQLYYAMTRYESLAKEEKEKYPSPFFDEQYQTAQTLTSKVQAALWLEVKKVDEAIEYIAKAKRDYSQFDEYASNMNQAQAEDRLAGNI